MYYLYGTVVSNAQTHHNMYIEITDGYISYVGKEKQNASYPVFPVEEGFICPGFIDTHIHGLSGHDVMDGEDAIVTIANDLPQHGVTSFLATTRTAPLTQIEQTLSNIKNYLNSKRGNAELLGVHVEGPWISQKYRGAQKVEHIRKFTREELDTVVGPYLDIISIITLAPEELEDISIITYLNERGIHVSAGHTNANMNEIEAAVGAGLSQITHMFNAMSPVHHRNPGTAAAALYFDTLQCELIADGLHVDTKMIQLLYKIKGYKKINLISDCTGYNHLDNGSYHFRNKDLIKDGNRVTLKDGTLAGSAITLDKAIKYVVETCDIPLEEAVYMATQSPLTAFHTNEKIGMISSGYRADMVILDPQLNVDQTFIEGKRVYKRMI